MSWEILVETIASELDAELRLEAQGEVRELTAAEEAGLSLHDRIRGSIGRFVTIRTLSSHTLNGTLRASGGDWLILERERIFMIIPENAIKEISGLGVAFVATERFPIPLNALLRRLVGISTTVVMGQEYRNVVIRSVGADYLAVEPAVDRRLASANTAYNLGDRYIPTDEVILAVQAIGFLVSGDIADVNF